MHVSIQIFEISKHVPLNNVMGKKYQRKLVVWAIKNNVFSTQGGRGRRIPVSSGSA